MSDQCYGVYRGRVESVDDPEKRFRYHVRVFTVHDETIPVEHLPFAETGFAFNASQSKLSADIPHFEVGDLVWIMFEGGDRNYPVITGGWISHSRGINDVPTDQGTNYSTTRRRWQRVDRSGNLIEVSELPDELHIKLQSGDATILVTQRHNEILLQALKGTVRVEAPKAEVVSDQAIVDAKEITVQATQLQDGSADLKGRAHFLAQEELNLHANLPSGDEAAINIGGYTPRLEGEFVDGYPPLQSPDVRVRSLKIHLGQREGVSDGPAGERPVTTQVEIHGAEYVKVDSPVLCDVRTTGDNSNIRVVNEGDNGKIEVLHEGDSGTVEVRSTGSNGKVKVESTQSEVDVHGNQLVHIHSEVKVKVNAPSIEIG